jgi:outer membrane protein assembly factor BamE (lipoprotein component of BamABCDE complex)
VKRKRLLILGDAALAAALIVLAALQLHAYRPNLAQNLARSRLIDPAHCRQINKGMTRAEVEAILGGPPGVYCTEYVGYGFVVQVGDCGFVDGDTVGTWVGNEGVISVGFDKQGRAKWLVFEEASRPPPSPSLAYWLRAWLRRLWP